MSAHFAEEHEFRIRCSCGRVFSETTESRARDRFEMHRIMSGEAGSGNAPTPAPASDAGSVLPPLAPSDAGAPPPPIRETPGQVPALAVTDWEPAEVYEDDMRFVLSLIDWMNRHDTEDERYIAAGRLTIESKNGYSLGVLVLDDGSEKWRFVPHHDAWSDARGES